MRDAVAAEALPALVGLISAAAARLLGGAASAGAAAADGSPSRAPPVSEEAAGSAAYAVRWLAEGSPRLQQELTRLKCPDILRVRCRARCTQKSLPFPYSPDRRI